MKESKMMTDFRLAVIGGGPAGLAAALAAYEYGVRDVAVIERSRTPGGILPQCIHSGFGLHYFKKELTGPEYAQRLADRIKELKIPVFTQTMVLSLDKDRTVYASGSACGYIKLKPEAVIAATGCRERPAGAINLCGDRPSGIMTAGTAQRYINIEGYMVGRNAVILGSGDIGLIMARRLTLEGAKVKAVVEIMPYSGGLTRNIVQCLDDFNIPLYLSHTVLAAHGKKRLERVTVGKVDGNRLLTGESFDIDCDTLLLSVGLIPENELLRDAGVSIDPRTGGALVDERLATDTEGIFACGNALHVHDLADNASLEGETAGRAAADYILNGIPKEKKSINITAGAGTSYTVPQKMSASACAEVFFRASRPFNEAVITVCGIKNGVGEILNKKKIERAVPAEMESVRIANIGDDFTGVEISIKEKTSSGEVEAEVWKN